MLNSYSMYGTTPGIEDRRAPNAAAVIALDKDKVPTSFPMLLWQQQATRYFEYWRWFTGDMLNERRAKTTEGKEVLKYPLGINPVRNFVRKHAAFLLGEEAFDTPRVPVKTIISPKSALDGSEFTDEDKRLAKLCERIVDGVWIDSNGRALQQENAELQQFLGGCVFQVCWQPWRSDELQIPIVVKNWPADFFLPIWRADDYWNLLEAFIVYRIPGYVASEMYGITEVSATSWHIYCEHWTQSHYSIFVDGKPITSSFSGKEVTYNKVKNPFGFVPFVYIPHLREGNFFGPSLVEDIRGLTRELNARFADLGDAVRDTIHRKRYAKNITGSPKPLQLDPGIKAINVGRSDPVTKNDPDVWTEDPPKLEEAMATLTDKLWKQLNREGALGDMPFGEDEGSQRSALTLAFRMWPSTSHARAERQFWIEGLNTIAKFILKMAFIKQNDIESIKDAIPQDFQRRIQFNQDFLPMIPRDREQANSEIILRFQAGLLSPEKALEMSGDIDYIQDEIKRIKEWQTFQSELAQKPGDDGESASGGKAETQSVEPIATDGLSETA